MSLVSIESPTLDKVLRVALIVILVAGVIGLIFGGWMLFKHRYDNQVITAHDAKENAKLEGQTAVANSSMAIENAADVATVTIQRQELRNASNPPPTVHDGLSDRQRRGCIIMRQQGQDLARVPACRSLAR